MSPDFALPLSTSYASELLVPLLCLEEKVIKKSSIVLKIKKKNICSLEGGALGFEVH